MTGTVTVAPARAGLAGTLAVPGDKSIAHRVLLFGALARGETVLRGFTGGRDNLATLAACRALGVAVDVRGHEVRIRGGGWAGLARPAATLDCENSGTTIRFLCGVLAGRPFASRLDGDASLRRRPMQRIIDPLAAMGAAIVAEGAGGRAPLRIDGRPLHGAAHVLPVASAQLKSALVLAGLQAAGTTSVVEPAPSRDHTERLLRDFGVRLDAAPGRVAVAGPQELTATAVGLPGDFSSAAFPLVAATIVPGSDVRLTGVGVNPTRTGLLDALRAMGAAVEIEPETGGAEPRATLRVRSAALRGIRVDGELMVRAIDEFPILCVAATAAEGVTELRDAAELRVKESDRVAVMAGLLRALGADVEELPDGLRIAGPARLGGARAEPHGDHRIAMAAAVAGLVSRDGVVIDDAGCAEVSYPGFYAALTGLRRDGGA